MKIADARLKFEINATDNDGGVQVFLDADQWKRMSIFDPEGRRIFTTKTDGIMRMQGGTELFMESAEPPFDELPLDQLLERWPAGKYEFRGVRLDGKTLTGAARLTHDLPAGPVLVSPTEGDRRQDPNDTVVRWKRVPPANGSPIIGYQVLVVRPDTGMKALPNVILDVMMPPTANRLRVPRGFLQSRTDTSGRSWPSRKVGTRRSPPRRSSRPSSGHAASRRTLIGLAGAEHVLSQCDAPPPVGAWNRCRRSTNCLWPVQTLPSLSATAGVRGEHGSRFTAAVPSEVMSEHRLRISIPFPGRAPSNPCGRSS